MLGVITKVFEKLTTGNKPSKKEVAMAQSLQRAADNSNNQRMERQADLERRQADSNLKNANNLQNRLTSMRPPEPPEVEPLKIDENAPIPKQLQQIADRITANEQRTNNEIRQLNKSTQMARVESTTALVNQYKSQKTIAEDMQENDRSRKLSAESHKLSANHIIGTNNNLGKVANEKMEFVEEFVLDKIKTVSFVAHIISKWGKKLFNFLFGDILSKINFEGLTNAINKIKEKLDTFLYPIANGIQSIMVRFGLKGQLNPTASDQTTAVKAKSQQSKSELDNMKIDYKALEKDVNNITNNKLDDIYGKKQGIFGKDEHKQTKETIKNIIELLKSGRTENQLSKEEKAVWLDFKNKFAEKDNEGAKAYFGNIEKLSSMQSQMNKMENSIVKSMDSILDSIAKDMIRFPASFNTQNELAKRQEIAMSIGTESDASNLLKKIFIEGLEDFYDQKMLKDLIDNKLPRVAKSGKPLETNDFVKAAIGNYLPFLATMIYQRLDPIVNHYNSDNPLVKYRNGEYIKKYRQQIASRMPMNIWDSGEKVSTVDKWYSFDDGNLSGDSSYTQLNNSIQKMAKELGFKAKADKKSGKYQFINSKGDIVKEFNKDMMHNMVTDLYKQTQVAYLKPVGSYYADKHSTYVSDETKKYLNNLSETTDSLDMDQINEVNLDAARLYGEGNVNYNAFGNQAKKANDLQAKNQEVINAIMQKQQKDLANGKSAKGFNYAMGIENLTYTSEAVSNEQRIAEAKAKLDADEGLTTNGSGQVVIDQSVHINSNNMSSSGGGSSSGGTTASSITTGQESALGGGSNI